MPPHEGFFNPNDIERVIDGRFVDCIGGPRDGESRRIDSNQCERGGCYVPLSVSLEPGYYWVRELRWVSDQ